MCYDSSLDAAGVKLYASLRTVLSPLHVFSQTITVFVDLSFKLVHVKLFKLLTQLHYILNSPRRNALSLVSTVCFPHKFLLHISKTYRGNWITYVEFVPHVLSTSNRTYSIPYVFFCLLFLSIRFIQSEDKSWWLIAFADSTGAWEYTKSCMLSVCYYCKGLINCLLWNNE